MAKKLLIVCALLALISTSLFAQYDMKAPLPMDPNVRIGKLANGLTYYIRHNAEPKERASFYIIQNVGAILENDDQDGFWNTWHSTGPSISREEKVLPTCWKNMVLNSEEM